MSSGLYAEGKKAILRGADLVSGDIRAVLVKSGYTPNLATHRFLSDISAPNRLAVASVDGQALVQTSTKVAFALDPTTFTSVPFSEPAGAVVLYVHTGVDATSSLIGYFDYFDNLPIYPDGRDIIATWPGSSDYVFSL